MLRRVELLAIIPQKKYTTIYLYNSDFKILLPLKIEKWNRTATHITAGILSILEQTKSRLLNITIYKKTAGISYVQDKYMCESFFDQQNAIKLAQKKDLPIFAEDQLVFKQGIFVNKEMFINLGIY